MGIEDAIGEILGSVTGGANSDSIGGGVLGNILGGVLGGGAMGGAMSGSAGGAMSGGLSGGIGGALGGLTRGHPILAMVLPMLVSGGLSNILGQFSNKGLGAKAQSWVGTGDNEPLESEEVGTVLGEEQINELAAKSNLSPAEVRTQLAQGLPQLIDHLTPNGQLPSEDELTSALNQ